MGKTKNGKSREIDCDVLVDPNGNELAGQQFDESGRCINENEVLSRAANSGQIPPAQNQQQGGYGAPPQQGYGTPPQPGYGAPPPNMGGPGYPPQPYGQPGYGAPPPGFGAPPPNM